MKKSIIIIILLLIIIASFFYFSHNKQQNTITLQINNQSFTLEQAITLQEKQKGLMGRKSLEENQGMIFIFDQEEQRSFWMKNTLIPLDMIFIDKNNRITSIQTAQPCINDPCQTYRASAQYIIELNAGIAEKIGLKEEDELQI